MRLFPAYSPAYPTSTCCPTSTCHLPAGPNLPARPGRRRRRALTTALAALLTLLAGGSAAAQDSTLTRLARQNQLPLLAAPGAQFSGAGWEKLRQDIQKSQFVLVGESHGLAQIPAFTTALARELKPAMFVTEIDKYQAQDLTRLAAQPGLPTAFERQHPGALSFFSWTEEFELARALRAQNVALVGIEQVGAATPGRFFSVLADKVKSRPAQAYLRQFAAASQRRELAIMRKGTSVGSTMNTLRPAGLDSLRTLTQKESPEVRQMVADFAASYQIYQAAFAGTPGSHQARINLMMRNLLQALPAYRLDQPRPNLLPQPLPKMLFKLGASHMARGLSPWAGIPDVGSLASNLASAQDHKSLHIMVMGQQGTQLSGSHPDPAEFAKNATAYSNADADFLRPFLPATKAAWNLVSLRPLRRAVLNNQLRLSDPQLSAIILGYDYLIVIPETTASHNY